VVILNASKDKKNVQKQKVRGANLRRRAERYLHKIFKNFKKISEIFLKIF